MPVLLSLLATGCQTGSRLTQSHQAAAIAAVALLISLHWRSSSEGAGSPRRGCCMKMSLGAPWANFPWLSCFASHIHSDRADMGWQWGDMWGLYMKRNRKRPNWLPLCLWESLILACHQSLTVLTKCVSLCMYAGVSPSPESALSHTQISVWVKAACPPDSLHCRAFLFAHCFLIDYIGDYTHLIPQS